MNTITLNKKPVQYKDYVRRSALDTDYDTLISEDCVLVEDGKIRAIYLRIPGITTEILPYLKALRYDETTRWNCGELTDELARIRQLKLKRELKRAGIEQGSAETLGGGVR